MKQIKISDETHAMLKALAKANNYAFDSDDNYIDLLNHLVRNEWDNPAWELCNDREEEVKKYKRTVAIRDYEYTRLINK